MSTESRNTGMSCLQSVRNVLGELVSADSAAAVRQTGGLLLNAIEERRSRHRDVTTDEMRAILEERDAAVGKVKIKLAFSRAAWNEISDE